MIGDIHAATISNCSNGNIGVTEYWNKKRDVFEGYWYNEHDIKKYVTLAGNGSLLVSYKFLLC